MLVRVGKDLNDETLGRRGAIPAVMRGRLMAGWIFLTEEAVQTQDDLKIWVDIALTARKAVGNPE